eukprot:tig00020911_g15753.t1
MEGLLRRTREAERVAREREAELERVAREAERVRGELAARSGAAEEGADGEHPPHERVDVAKENTRLVEEKERMERARAVQRNLDLQAWRSVLANSVELLQKAAKGRAKLTPLSIPVSRMEDAESVMESLWQFIKNPGKRREDFFSAWHPIRVCVEGEETRDESGVRADFARKFFSAAVAAYFEPLPGDALVLPAPRPPPPPPLPPRPGPGPPAVAPSRAGVPAGRAALREIPHSSLDVDLNRSPREPRARRRRRGPAGASAPATAGPDPVADGARRWRAPAQGGNGKRPAPAEDGPKKKKKGPTGQQAGAGAKGKGRPRGKPAAARVPDGVESPEEKRRVLLQAVGALMARVLVQKLTPQREEAARMRVDRRLEPLLCFLAGREPRFCPTLDRHPEGFAEVLGLLAPYVTPEVLNHFAMVGTFNGTTGREASGKEVKMTRETFECNASNLWFMFGGDCACAEDSCDCWRGLSGEALARRCAQWSLVGCREALLANIRSGFEAAFRGGSAEGSPPSVTSVQAPLALFKSYKDLLDAGLVGGSPWTPQSVLASMDFKGEWPGEYAHMQEWLRQAVLGELDREQCVDAAKLAVFVTANEVGPYRPGEEGEEGEEGEGEGGPAGLRGELADPVRISVQLLLPNKHATFQPGGLPTSSTCSRTLRLHAMAAGAENAKLFNKKLCQAVGQEGFQLQ